MKKTMHLLTYGLCAIAVLLLGAWVANLGQPTVQPAEEWQKQSWMQADPTAPAALVKRILSMTDLPVLEPAPTPEDFLAAKALSKDVGCNGGVLSHSWPSLELKPGQLTLDELKGAVMFNEGRRLFLGIQVVNTTVKELPADVSGLAFDDPQLIERFKSLLDGLAPLLRSRVRYLSIGNETDVYLAMHPEELKPFQMFLEAARKHARSISSDLVVGTTLTDAAVGNQQFVDLVQNMDAHFLTYYHGQHGLDGQFKDPSSTKSDLVALLGKLDDRPVCFQEIGYPAHEAISSPTAQAEFVSGVFDAWEESGDRIAFVNYFMLYDFPASVVEDQVSYYGVTEGQESLVQFLSSLGLHEVDGTARPAWSVFEKRAQQLMKH